MMNGLQDEGGSGYFTTWPNIRTKAVVLIQEPLTLTFIIMDEMLGNYPHTTADNSDGVILSSAFLVYGLEIKTSQTGNQTVIRNQDFSIFRCMQTPHPQHDQNWDKDHS